MQRISFRRPDDWHVHFRDGAVLAEVVPHTARAFGRAVVMPNLAPPVTTTAAATAYRARILAAVPAGIDFSPLTTAYLTDDSDAADLITGHREGVLFGAKLYPAHATTNSQFGVTSIAAIAGVLAAMERAGMPLLVHGEVTGAEVDVFDREARFVETVLVPLLADFPGLKVVLEHVTTAEGVAVVQAHAGRMAATVTPQHLLWDRNALFRGGIRPHLWCLPVLKRSTHKRALRAAVTGGDPSFFLGTDTAPHLRHTKETACGCAGIFSAPTALEAYLTVFAEEGALDRFEAFASLNGPAFHGLPPNEMRVTWEARPRLVAEAIAVPGEGELVPMFAGETVAWSPVATETEAA
ncbi:dihydroorotase [Siculibacillus lacustris]|uniref:Dihydroorotase n=1 Tax=Siculibacillus lacustris TaxID=1549641 RepID=A0A4Q9VV28_9HYPH|nr:dihydroorotase [Siculibacillus lacustris]TBW40095.1 dihydroorotase [Siculibacillus lacustris]